MDKDVEYVILFIAYYIFHVKFNSQTMLNTDLVMVN